MPITTTQTDFRSHLKAYLDQVTDKNHTVLVYPLNQRTVAVYLSGATHHAAHRGQC
ncbi:hypothetical protein S101258_00093 [Lactiplantibacillus plantarum subsp. plantarum]|uniref:Uncharacterized protein n=1 Tax=Lactiplantibacillus plantarum subsp. plantarum TaxID=337330 RepID=A0A2S3U9X2_LACPN|nr:hypothetical protein S101258_00093 [Lactiplantibacillus plantarum subsp. plantarum]